MIHLQTYNLKSMFLILLFCSLIFLQNASRKDLAYSIFNSNGQSRVLDTKSINTKNNSKLSLIFIVLPYIIHCKSADWSIQTLEISVQILLFCELLIAS